MDWFVKPEQCYDGETEYNVDTSEDIFDGFESIDVDGGLLFNLVLFMGVEFDLLQQMVVYCMVAHEFVAQLMTLVDQQMMSIL